MRKLFLILLSVLVVSIFLFGCGGNGSQMDDTPISDIATAQIGEIVKLGTYNGKPIEWNIVYKEEGLCLLVAKDAVVEKPYNNEGGSTSPSSDLYSANEWSKCSLRKWLNEDFYNNAFSDEAKNYIVKCNLTNDVSEAYTKSGGENTEDKVFILSFSECDKFLYSYSNDLLDIGGKEYWLRTPSGTNGLSTKVCDGYLWAKKELSEKVDVSVGVRPALWVSDKGIKKTSLNVPAASHEKNSDPQYSPDDFGYYDYDGNGQISDDEFQDAVEYYMDENGY